MQSAHFEVYPFCVLQSWKRNHCIIHQIFWAPWISPNFATLIKPRGARPYSKVANGITNFLARFEFRGWTWRMSNIFFATQFFAFWVGKDLFTICLSIKTRPSEISWTPDFSCGGLPWEKECICAGCSEAEIAFDILDSYHPNRSHNVDRNNCRAIPRKSLIH